MKKVFQVAVNCLSHANMFGPLKKKVYLMLKVGQGLFWLNMRLVTTVQIRSFIFVEEF